MDVAISMFREESIVKNLPKTFMTIDWLSKTHNTFLPLLKHCITIVIICVTQNMQI